MSEPESAFPPMLEVKPLARPPHATVRVPGSKSITNRALVLAALTRRGCEVKGALRSEDTNVMIESLRRLGFSVAEDWASGTVAVRSPNVCRVIPADSADLWVANSGTTMRFLTALVSVGSGRYRLDGVARMRERPIGGLLDALRQVGVEALSEADNGCPPVIVAPRGGWQGSEIHIRGDVSSQFLSGLMMAAVASQKEWRTVRLFLDGPLVSAPYVEMTLDMMEAWGIEAGWDRDGKVIMVEPHWQGSPAQYGVEPDASAASYFWAAAALTGGAVRVEGLTARSLQGDIRFVDVLRQMGCAVRHEQGGITVEGRPLRGIDVDMNDISDTVMTLAAVACFADGPTTIRNVAHVRHKETDRLAALATELRRLGAEVEERADGLTITPGRLRGAEVETYDDHRMAMSLALVGLRVPGVVIKNPACVSKTYPGFFADLERLRC
ncbi:MAG TPA: 3-phosphoshikimate 1-carboxyvinyltransferase [Gemmataceae bacterium]|nr:3-phosphoshikimate 1-carboxyvinyltransferase [Gemmataceae bacterium]